MKPNWDFLGERQRQVWHKRASMRMFLWLCTRQKSANDLLFTEPPLSNIIISTLHFYMIWVWLFSYSGCIKEKSAIVAFPVLLIPDVWPVWIHNTFNRVKHSQRFNYACFGLVTVAVSPHEGTFGNILPKLPSFP